MWLLLNGNLSTKGFIAEIEIINYEDARFPFCCEEIETINHLFHHCTITWNFQGRFMHWFGCLSYLPRDLNQNLQKWFGSVRGNYFQRQAITLLCKGYYWSIQITLNKLIFESMTPDWNVIFYLIFHHLGIWLKSSIRNFNYTGSDLFKNLEYILNSTNQFGFFFFLLLFLVAFL